MSPVTPLIDAHIHLWRYTPEEFSWLDEPMAALRRDFSVDDLATELQAASVDSAVVVQARQSMAETRWLCGLAEKSPLIRGVVGWAPIAAREFADTLDELSGLARLVGLRHVVQGEATGFLDGDAFNAGVALLADTGLTYDILIFERQMEEAIRFVDRHPRQAFVLNHVGKPRIAAGEIELWRTHLQELAQRPNVMCKLSGMVTEAEWSGWSVETLKPYIDACVESFGPSRLMAGTDWPVCLVATTYSKWWSLLQEYFARFTRDERVGVFGGNAVRFYQLS